MKLQKISYVEFEGLPSEWRLDDLVLGNINLIVGKNATGKSRTLGLINNLAKIISGSMKPFFSSGNFNAEFDDNGKVLQYNVEVENSCVIKEEFILDGQKLLTRGRGGVGDIFTKTEDKFMKFQTPESDLAIVARRDSIQHDFIEPLWSWSNAVHFYLFGTSLGKEHGQISQSDENAKFNLNDKNLVVGALDNGLKQFGDDFKRLIMKDMAYIGYNISDVGIKPLPIPLLNNVTLPFRMLFLQEEGLGGITEQISISQGMFRVLSVVIQINLAEMISEPACIIIDDIGEGLDFERSCKIIELLIQKTRDRSVQLIMSTND